MAHYDTAKLIAHLSSKWGGKSCPMCIIGHWNISDSTFQLTEFNSGGMVIGGPVVPVIPLTCSNCGNVILVNAIAAGVVDSTVPGNL